MTTGRVAGGQPETRRAALDDPLTEALVRTRRFFTRGEVSRDARTLHQVYRSRDAQLGARKPRRGWERVGS